VKEKFCYKIINKKVFLALAGGKNKKILKVISHSLSFS